MSTGPRDLNAMIRDFQRAERELRTMHERAELLPGKPPRSHQEQADLWTDRRDRVAAQIVEHMMAGDNRHTFATQTVENMLGEESTLDLRFGPPSVGERQDLTPDVQREVRGITQRILDARTELAQQRAGELEFNDAPPTQRTDADRHLSEAAQRQRAALEYARQQHERQRTRQERDAAQQARTDAARLRAEAEAMQRAADEAQQAIDAAERDERDAAERGDDLEQ